MRAFGAVLRLQYRAGRAIWWLEPGGEIEEAAAVAVVVSNSVTPVDPGLFPDLNCPAQTYKLVL